MIEADSVTVVTSCCVLLNVAHRFTFELHVALLFVVHTLWERILS